MEKIIHYIIIAILTFLISCTPEIKEKNNIYIVLFDISGSVNKKEIQDSYYSNFETIIKTIKEGDVLVSGVINDKSLNQNEFSVNYKFPIFIETTDNDLYAASEQKTFDSIFKSTKDSILNEIHSLIYNFEQSPETDIFGALLLAEKIFNNYNDDSTYKKVLVVFSDMKQCTKDFNFESKTPQNQKDIRQIITKLDTKKLIPDFAQAKVYISGVNTYDTDSFTELQEFWCEYFKSCNADFNKDRFAATLINFDEN